VSYLELLEDNRVPFAKPLLGGTRQDGRPTESEINDAMRLLNLAGCRIIAEDCGFLIGIWDDLDGPELRRAIWVLGMGEHRIVHLESREIAIQFKSRRCPERHRGESVSSWRKRAEEVALRRLLSADCEL
jgi:hypothetical protein